MVFFQLWNRKNENSFKEREDYVTANSSFRTLKIGMVTIFVVCNIQKWLPRIHMNVYDISVHRIWNIWLNKSKWKVKHRFRASVMYFCSSFFCLLVPFFIKCQSLFDYASRRILYIMQLFNSDFVIPLRKFALSWYKTEFLL